MIFNEEKKSEAVERAVENCLKGVFAKNKRGYRRNAKNKRF